MAELVGLKASFQGLFRTNFIGHFRKLFLFTKFEFFNLQKKFPYLYGSTCIILHNKYKRYPRGLQTFYVDNNSLIYNSMFL